MSSVNFGISKIPTHCLKEALITWPLSTSGLLISQRVFRSCARKSVPEVALMQCVTACQVYDTEGKITVKFHFFCHVYSNRPIEVKTILTWHTESDKWNICPRIAFLCLSLFPLLYQYCMLFISAESIPSRNHVRVARLPSIHVGATLFQFSYWMRFQCLYVHLAKSCIEDLIEIYRKYTRDRAYR